MKKYCVIAFAMLVVFGLSGTPVHARGGGRGGGHGGGHHGGGHHGGGHHAGHHHAHHGNHHNGNHRHGYAHYNHGNRPFTHGWYGNHANAWRGYGYGNYWGAAGLGAATTWLGMSALNTPAVYATTAYPATTNVLTGDNATDGNASATPQTIANVQAPQPAAAIELAKSGAAEPGEGEWLPLGVYSLAPENHPDSTVMLQLAVNKQGIVRGTYFDLLSDKEQSVQGALDKKTQQVAFTVGTKTKAVFDTVLPNLTQERGAAFLHFGNGQTRKYSLTRMEAPAEDEKAEQAESNG